MLDPLAARGLAGSLPYGSEKITEAMVRLSSLALHVDALCMRRFETTAKVIVGAYETQHR